MGCIRELFTLSVAIALFGLFVSPVAGLYGSNTDVLIINSPAEFKSEVLESDDIVLVEFYAPWCGHCKSLAPEWEKAAKALKGVATLAAVDCDASPSMAQEYGVQGFPTIKIFGVNKKSPQDYQGGRDAKAIVDSALREVKSLVSARLSGKAGSSSSKGSGKGTGKGKQQEPSASVELTDDTFDDLVTGSSDLWIVEFFAPWCGHCKKLVPEWTKASIALKGRVKLGTVDCTTQTALAQRFGIKGFPTIKVFGADKENPQDYEGARTAGAIESFANEALESNTPPPEVVELTSQETMDSKCAPATICFVAFLPDILDTGAEGRNKYLADLAAVADKFKKNFYSYVWTAAGQQPDLERAVGVGGYGYPALIALSVKKAVYAPFKSSFTRDGLIDFVRTAGQGGRGNLPLEALPSLATSEPWDGLDGQLPEEDEFSLDDL